MFTRRATLALLAAPSIARAFPDRPIRWLVGYPAGGGSDVLARLLAAHMATTLGQPVVIENRPGAATSLAAEAAARAPADGHTILSADIGTLVFNPVLYRRLPYAVEDFRPLGTMAHFHLVLGVKAASAITSAAQLVERASMEPGRVDYGSPGVGSPHHLAMERIAQAAGVRLNHVPYRGMAPVMNDLLAGVIEAGVVDYAAGGEALRAGRIRPLAVASRTRLAGLPQVPTVTEALGWPRFEAYAWQALVTARGVPDPVAARLAQALGAAVGDAAIQARMVEIGLDPLPGGPGEQEALVAAEQTLWWPVVRALGVTLD
jgi:tripartite-type tricarboxylate transporter receptor subunit TctC